MDFGTTATVGTVARWGMSGEPALAAPDID